MNNPRPNPNAYIVLGAVFLVLAAVNGYLAWISPARKLFILSRYRTELRHTDDREEAIGLAVGRAGSAVAMFSITARTGPPTS